MGIFRKKITEVDIYNSTYNHILGDQFKEYHLKTNVPYDDAWVMAADRKISTLAMSAAWHAYRQKLDFLSGDFSMAMVDKRLDKDVESKKENMLDNISSMRAPSLRLAIGSFLIAFTLSEVGMMLSKDRISANNVEFCNKDKIAIIGNFDVTNDNTVKVKKIV